MLYCIAKEYNGISKSADIHANNQLDINKIQNANLVQDSTLVKFIDTLFWKLGFNQSSKGTFYLKYAIILAYTDQKLIYTNKKLIEIISKELNIKKETIRAEIDYSLHSMYRFSSSEILNEYFHENYDGRNPSTKYFIALCVNYINNVIGNKVINMYNFI